MDNYFNTLKTDEKHRLLREFFEYGIQNENEKIMFANNIMFSTVTQSQFNVDESFLDELNITNEIKEKATEKHNQGAGVEYEFVFPRFRELYLYMFLEFDDNYKFKYTYDTRLSKPGENEAKKTLINFYNLYFKKVTMGGRVYAMFRDDVNRLFDKKNLFDAFTKQKYEVTTIGANGGKKVEVVNAITKWWEEANLYENLDFIPYSRKNPVVINEKTINIFKGFTPPADSGNIDSILDFIKNVICSGNEKHYEFLMQWIAQIYNNPADKGTNGISIYLKGDKGVGKSIFGNLLVKLFGENHSFVTNTVTDIISDFNGALANKILVIGEEAIWGGNHAEHQRLKDIITSDKLVLKLKFKEPVLIKNCIRLLLLTNSDYLIAEKGERRFYAIEVSNIHQKDTVYFANLIKDINNNIGAFAKYIEDIYIEDYDFQKNYTKTESIIDSIEQSEDAVYDFAERFLELLDERLENVELKTTDLYNNFMEFKTSKYKTSKSIFIKRLRQIFPKIEIVKKGKAQVKFLKLYNVEEMAQDLEDYIRR